MKVIAGVEPEVFLRSAASESVFKSLRSPKMLVLSTHGFFLGNPSPDRLRQGHGSREAILSADPLLRSGLILAGYNRAGPRATGATTMGWLPPWRWPVATSAGLTWWSFRRARRAWGRSGGRRGRGLRQVFQIAGAKSIVASIWKVPDVESCQLMSLFFQRLSRGLGRR